MNAIKNGCANRKAGSASKSTLLSKIRVFEPKRRVTPACEAEANALMAAASKGDETAFGVMAERFRGLMLSVAQRITHCFPDAEDAVQDALVVVWRDIPHFEVESAVAFLVWQSRLAAIRLKTKRTAQKRGGKHPEQHDSAVRRELYGLQVITRCGIEHEMKERVPDDDGMAKLGAVHRMLGEVPACFVNVLDQYFFKEKSLDTLARERCTTSESVKRTLHNGLEVIRHLVDKDEELKYA